MAKKFKRPAESWEYVLKRDRDLPPEEQSRFVLRPLTMTEHAAAMSGLAETVTLSDGTRATRGRSRMVGIYIAVQNIVSVENFPSDGPQAWPAERDARMTYLEALHDDDVQEIADEIWGRSEIDDAAKN